MTDYALRLLMHLAREPQRRFTIAEVAQAHDISQAHLTKITHQLGLEGWIETVRGKGGGMRLARPAASIRIGDVVRRFEPGFELVECFSVNSQCRLTGQCRLNGILDGALRSFMAHLDAYTLADVPLTAERPLLDARRRRALPRPTTSMTRRR